MPELPEVETIRKQLHPLLSGLQIVDAGSHPSAKFSSAVEAVGYQIRGVSRRGKYLIFALSDQASADNSASLSEACELIIHLGMTGRLAVSPSADLSHPHLRAWWHLDNNQTLTFHDIRRFGRVYVVAAGRYENIATLSRLGPEPFSDEFTGEALWRSLRLSSRYLKTQLLSQRPVAGVGNIYADEALSSSDAARRNNPNRSCVRVTSRRDHIARLCVVERVGRQPGLSALLRAFRRTLRALRC